MQFEGKVALITGGGTGIGRGCALALAHAGADVAVNFPRSRDDAEATARDVQALGRRSVAVQADVSVDAQARALVSAVQEQLGRLDVLVNNAGYTQFVPHEDLEALTEAIWDRTLAVNVKGAFFVSRAALPELRAHRGCIVNVASVAGLTGEGSSIAYAASKAGVISVTKSLARAFAPDVRVNAVAPGVVETRWVAGQHALVQSALARTPLGRLGTPEDVAGAVVYLAGATWVTGQVMVLNGGLNI